MTEERRQLVAANRGIALAVLRRMGMRPDEETKAEAMLGLCQAAETWDESKAHTLSTHLWNGVRWHLCKWLERKRMTDILSLTADGEPPENFAGEDASGPDDLLQLKTSALAIRAALRGTELDRVAGQWMKGFSIEQSSVSLCVSKTTVVRRRTKIHRILKENL